MAVADDLPDIIQAVGQAGPIAAEYTEIDNRVGCIVIPEDGMLAVHGVTAVTSGLHGFVKAPRYSAARGRVAAGEDWQCHQSRLPSVFGIDLPDSTAPLRIKSFD